MVIFLFIQECFIVVVIFFYSRVFHVPLNLNIFNQKHIIVFDLRPFKRTVHESFKLDLFDITTKNTLKVMIHLFTRVLQTPNSEHLQPKAHFCDLRLYKRTFYKSFKSLSVITAKNETDNWVDSIVCVRHIYGDIEV